MPDTDGLSSGPILQPNLSVSRADGLTPGMVSNAVAGIFRGAAGGTDMNVYNTVAKGGIKPAFQSFQGNGPDPLTHIQSTLEQAVGGADKEPDTSALGPLKAMTRAIFTGLGSPVATISDALSRAGDPTSIGGRLARIDALQKNFFNNHGVDLDHLQSAMTAALSDIKDLATLMSDDSMREFHLSTGPLTAILNQKKDVGRELSSQLVDAIANEDDPDEKSKLEAEKKDVDAWLTDCDKRLAKDANQISDLQKRTNAVQRVAGTQSQALMNAALGDHPSSLYNDGKLVSTTHTQPDAVAYALGLRNSLIQSRVQMNGAIAGM
jgi:hypothetical protein